MATLHSLFVRIMNLSVSTAAECPASLLASLRSTIPIFAGLSDETWSAAAATFRTQFFRNGDQICAKGDPAKALFIIWYGEVELTADGTYLLTRRKHQIIGEQALIEGIERGATMTARGDVQLIVVPRTTF